MVLTCEQAVLFGEKNSEEREGKARGVGGGETFSRFLIPNSPLDQTLRTKLRKSTCISAWNLVFFCVKIFNMYRFILKSFTN